MRGIFRLVIFIYSIIGFIESMCLKFNIYTIPLMLLFALVVWILGHTTTEINNFDEAYLS